MTAKNANSEITEWVRLHTKNLLAWAQSKVGDLQVAEDLVQDTFVAAVEHFSSFRNESHPNTWLISILNNKISEHYRAKAKRQSQSADSAETLEYFFTANGRWKDQAMPHEWEQEEHLLDNEQFLSVLQLCMDKLPESWHTCIQFKFISEKTAENICQELNISATNYWQIIHRAKLQLRHCLEQHWFRDREEERK